MMVMNRAGTFVHYNNQIKNYNSVIHNPDIQKIKNYFLPVIISLVFLRLMYPILFKNYEQKLLLYVFLPLTDNKLWDGTYQSFVLARFGL